MTKENGAPPDSTGGEMLSAGRFAAATMLSAEALRIYAARGLLTPSVVEPGNGYRYDHRNQIETGWVIGLLRSGGLGLDDIATILQSEPAAALNHLDQAVTAQTTGFHAGQHVLDRAHRHLTKETDMPDPATSTAVTTTLVADQAVLSVLRRMTPADMPQVVIAELTRLRAAATANHLTPTGDPFGIFHSPITDDSNGPLEITLPVDDLVDIHGDSDIRSYRLTGGLAANRDATGPDTYFPAILTVYDDVHAWISNTGHTPVGPPREIWHNSPFDADPLRLTISWPYASQ